MFPQSTPSVAETIHFMKVDYDKLSPVLRARVIGYLLSNGISPTDFSTRAEFWSFANEVLEFMTEGVEDFETTLEELGEVPVSDSPDLAIVDDIDPSSYL